MSLGRRLFRLRRERQWTQRELAERAGVSVSYLSRLENDRLTPSVGTLQRLAAALGVDVPDVFSGPAQLEASDRCPVSLSGRCILDHVFRGRGRAVSPAAETYTEEQLELLRVANFLLHAADERVAHALAVVLRSMLAATREGAAAASESIPAGREA